MHRIFCATAWEHEAERRRFQDLIGDFNESRAMGKGVLFVPISLVNVTDKRPYQYLVEENIRDCRHYLLILFDDWGPPQRNFKNDYHLALQAGQDPALPMHSIAVLAKKSPSGEARADGLPAPDAWFSTPQEFDDCLMSLLSSWLDADTPAPSSRSAASDSPPATT